MRKIRYAFTMIELIFVIVVIAILSKFGVEFLAQAYNSFIFSSINNSLQAKSASALGIIGSRLQFRIKDSIIARDPGTSFEALGGSTLGANATVLEWVGYDIDGLRGDTRPLWSGIIDLNPSTTSSLVSPDTNMTALNNLIGALGGSTVNNAALYFIGSDSDIQNGYGWDGTALANQNETMHPIKMTTDNTFIPIVGQSVGLGAVNDFNGTDVYEYYQLAWTAYAIELNTANGNLTLWYDYQPWEGEGYSSGSSALLMENVDTFRFKSIGSVVKIQICVNSSVIDTYSLCKEKTIY